MGPHPTRILRHPTLTDPSSQGTAADSIMLPVAPLAPAFPRSILPFPYAYGGKILGVVPGALSDATSGSQKTLF
jgi:hypothetical protein